MAIVNSLENGYFVLDTPDIRWIDAAAGRTVEIAITPQNGAAVSFTENYTPDSDDAVIVRGLAGLLQTYVSPVPTTGATFQLLLTTAGVWAATLSLASWTAKLYAADGETQVGSTLTSKAYYASQRTNTRPGLSPIWLSRYTERDIVPQQQLVGCFMMASGISARLRVYYQATDGTLQTVVVTPSLTGVAATTPPTQAAVLHYTLSALATAVNASLPAADIIEADDIQQVDFELMQNSAVVDTLRYRIDRTHKKVLRVVAFTNCFGMLETEALTGSEASDTQMEGDYSYMDDQYEKVAQQLVTNARLCAGAVNTERRNSIRDITTSPEVFIIHNGVRSCFERVTVTGLELKDQQPHTTFQTAYITLRPSHRHQEVVSRGAVADTEQLDGIFDYTFDDSFN